MLQVHSDWSGPDDKLKKFENLPSGRTKRALDAVLQTGFGLTQAAVHTETGALKSSGKADSKLDRMDHSWEGEITYGDEQGPVDYAIYEKRRGVHWAGASSAKGDHDFFRPLEALDPLWVAAVKGALEK